MTTHGDISHLYATVRYKGTGTWVGETSQFGLRMGVFFGDTLPALSSGSVPLVAHQIEETTVIDTSTLHQRREFYWTNAPGSTAYSQGFQAAVLDKLVTFVNSVRPHLYGYQFQDIRLYPVQPDGNIPSGVSPTILETTDNSYGASGTGSSLPPESACCISWNSAVRSRKGRGRMFIGPLATQQCLAADGTVASTAKTALATAGATLVSQLRGISSTAGQATACPIVWQRGSKVLGVFSGGMHGSVINLARVDDKFDSQRRRQHQHVPVWTEVPVS